MTAHPTIRVFTAFCGYDSQLLALERLHRTFPAFRYECVGWCDIDHTAIKVHNALFPALADKNYGDISTIDWDSVPDFDLFTYSSPCQDFSTVGKRQGGTEGSGTRSSLLWECRRRRTLRRRYRETREAAWQGKPAPTRLPCTTVPHHVRMATSKLCARYGYVRTADPYTLARTATTHRVRYEALHTRRHHLTFVDL